VERGRSAFLRTDKTRLLLKGSFGSIALWVLSLALRFIVGVVVVRLLGAESYGLYAYAAGWLTFISLPTTLGLDQVALRYTSAYAEKESYGLLRGVLLFSFSRAGGTALLAAIFGSILLLVLPNIPNELRVTMWVVLVALPFVVLSNIRQSVLRGLDLPVIAQIPENIIYPALFMGLVYAASLFGNGVSAPRAALANTAAWLVTFLVGLALLAIHLPQRLRHRKTEFDRTSWSRMVLPLLISGGAYHLVSRGDVLILGMFEPSDQVGIYAVASRTAEQLMFLLYTAVTLAGASLFSSIYAGGDKQELQRFSNLITNVLFLGSLPIYVALMIAAPWVLRIFGTEFLAGTAVMRLLFTFYFASSLTGFVIVMLYMTGHERDVAVVMSLFALLNLATSVVLIPRFGILGAGISAGSTLILLHTTLAVIVHRRIGIVLFPFHHRLRRVFGI